jgi:hypothetical protein
MGRYKLIETPELLWEKLIGINENYEVSNYGEVRTYSKRNSLVRYENPVILKQQILKTHCKEYKRIILMVNGKQKAYYVHRLVGLYFIKNTENKPQINHIDNNPLNNNVNNLEWVNNSENQRHRFNSIEKDMIYIYFDKRYSKYRVQIKHLNINSKNFLNIDEARIFRNNLIN